MFGLPSIGKLLVLAAIIAVVWFGFRYFGREARLRKGERRPGERGFMERLRKAMHEKFGATDDAAPIEDTEKCPTCGTYVPVSSPVRCGRPACPY